MKVEIIFANIADLQGKVNRFIYDITKKGYTIKDIQFQYQGDSNGCVMVVYDTTKQRIQTS